MATDDEHIIRGYDEYLVRVLDDGEEVDLDLRTLSLDALNRLRAEARLADEDNLVEQIDDLIEEREGQDADSASTAIVARRAYNGVAQFSFDGERSWYGWPAAFRIVVQAGFTVPQTESMLRSALAQID